ncbi:hypothetical protein [Saccharopolyspora elongata]|nr:hypothetical protein [Saccharopolyspora elongata]
MLNCPTYWAASPRQPRPAATLPFAYRRSRPAYLHTPVQALLDGKPWQQRIRYDQARQLLQPLTTSSFIVISYLSAMRRSHCGAAVSDTIRSPSSAGRPETEGAVDASGAKRAEGEHREDP